MAHGQNWRTFPGNLPNWILRLYDPHAHALTIIQEEHRLAHDGMMFNATGKVLALGIGATHDMLINTGQSYPHLNRLSLSFGSGDIDVDAYEDPTVSAAGTAVDAQNTNRNSSNTHICQITNAPTVTDVGDLLHTTWAVPTSTGVGQTHSGLANLDQGEEWILKPNTLYLVRITNNSGSVIDMSFDMLWYELTYSQV